MDINQPPTLTLNHPAAPRPTTDAERAELIKNLHAFTQRKNRVTSHETYFTKEYADWARSIIDNLLANQNTRDYRVVIPYRGRAQATLLNMWYQGFKYLNQHDPVYAALKRQIVATKKPNFLALQFKAAKDLPETYAHQAWRADLIGFLESANPGDLFKQDMLSLSTAEVDQARNMLAPLAEDFEYRIDTHIIWVARRHD